MIGVSLSSISPNTQGSKYAQKKGAIIRYIIKGGPADKGGLKVGDLIKFEELINGLKAYGIENNNGTIR